MEENDCKFWTYQVKNGNCFLKTSDANRKSDKHGAISGSSGCSTGKGGSITGTKSWEAYTKLSAHSHKFVELRN